ncbi:hypothetical protein BaRGS_00002710 [Batillaria attramentaria]|uniref:Uncharacterized protein n=1 Tax=Batillaria attramentaria TaxID=370345 RepID=A0ABD0M2T4_9CAEN
MGDKTSEGEQPPSATPAAKLGSPFDGSVHSLALLTYSLTGSADGRARESAEAGVYLSGLEEDVSRSNEANGASEDVAGSPRTSSTGFIICLTLSWESVRVSQQSGNSTGCTGGRADVSFSKSYFKKQRDHRNVSTISIQLGKVTCAVPRNWDIQTARHDTCGKKITPTPATTKTNPAEKEEPRMSND